MVQAHPSFSPEVGKRQDYREKALGLNGIELATSALQNHRDSDRVETVANALIETLDNFDEED